MSPHGDVSPLRHKGKRIELAEPKLLEKCFWELKPTLEKGAAWMEWVWLRAYTELVAGVQEGRWKLQSEKAMLWGCPQEPEANRKQPVPFFLLQLLFSFCCCSVTQSCSTLCDPWTAARQASLSFTIPQSLLKLMSIGSVMPSNCLVPCRPLLLPTFFPSIRVFSKESALRIRCPKSWSFSFSISLSNEYSGLIDFF